MSLASRAYFLIVPYRSESFRLSFRYRSVYRSESFRLSFRYRSVYRSESFRLSFRYRSIGATIGANLIFIGAIGAIIGANIEFIGDITGDMSAIIDDNPKFIGDIFYDIIYDTKRFTMTLVLLSMTGHNLVFTNIKFSMVEG